MRYFPILIFTLIARVAEAQQAPCATLPTKTPVPAGSTNQGPNRAAMASAQNHPDLAAKKQQFAEAVAKLDADPSVKAAGAKNRQLISAAATGAEVAKQKLQMAGQVAAAQSTAAYQNQKAVFQASLKCLVP